MDDRALAAAAVRELNAVPYGLEHRRMEHVVRRVPGPAVGVCGFGRCGSTMVMSMLVAGGMTPGNAADPPYEGDPAALHGRDLSGTCVKLLDGAGLASVPQGPTPSWRFVWLDRDPLEQAKSYVKFLRTLAPVTGVGALDRDIPALAHSYRRDRPQLLGLLRRIGPVLVLDFERVLANPRKAAKLLRREVWPGLDVAAAAGVVHVRDGACRPDLSAEFRLIGRGGSDG